jgi:hypothetical protein
VTVEETVIDNKFWVRTSTLLVIGTLLITFQMTGCTIHRDTLIYESKTHVANAELEIAYLQHDMLNEQPTCDQCGAPLPPGRNCDPCEECGFKGDCNP